METRDRRTNLLFFGGAFAAWVIVGGIVLTIDPVLVPLAGYIGAAVMGVAVGLTAIPLFWIAVFGRHRRIAYRGDWSRAVRRGGWAGLLVGLFVVFRLQGLFGAPIMLFILALVVVAETTLSVER